ncbi:MAG: phospholipase D family protein [Bacteroidia bacterium]|nr:phospholipase D family protein [Bacteroidia bacterium]
MPTIDFITQQFQNVNHKDSILEIFQIASPQEFLICSAFITEEGVSKIENELITHAGISRVYIGIANGISSAQGLLRLYKTGAQVMCVDTGLNGVIFHPKVFLGKSNTMCKIVVGSANLTLGGLHNNIETSTKIELDLSILEEQQALNSLLEPFNDLVTRFPQNIIEIQNRREIINLLNSGKLIDERLRRNVTSGVARTRGAGQITPRINLNITRPGIRRRLRRRIRATHAIQSTTPTLIGLELVWNLPELRRRHLQIPTNPSTHSTGVLSLTQGSFSEVDQTTYFRRVVFEDCNWTQDPTNPNKETTTITFEVVVSGSSYGEHNLLVSYNPAFESNQRNYTTSIHWGNVRNIIANENLLGNELNLYRKTGTNTFVIEIT